MVISEAKSASQQAAGIHLVLTLVPGSPVSSTLLHIYMMVDNKNSGGYIYVTGTSLSKQALQTIFLFK